MRHTAVHTAASAIYPARPRGAGAQVFVIILSNLEFEVAWISRWKCRDQCHRGTEDFVRATAFGWLISDAVRASNEEPCNCRTAWKSNGHILSCKVRIGGAPNHTDLPAFDKVKTKTKKRKKKEKECSGVGIEKVGVSCWRWRLVAHLVRMSVMPETPYTTERHNYKGNHPNQSIPKNSRKSFKNS